MGELIDERIYEYFISIIDMANKNEIEVALIKFPVSKEYYKVVGRYVKDKDQYYNTLNFKLKSEYPDVVILDYQKKFFDKPEYFSDSDHLNYKGASALTEIIKNDLTL